MGNLISNHNCLKCFDQRGGCDYCNDEIIIAEPHADMVNHPKHYQIEVGDAKIEVTELIEEVLTREEYIGFLKGNVLKYHIRAHSKNGEEDIKKANFYSVILDRILNETNNNNTP